MKNATILLSILGLVICFLKPCSAGEVNVFKVEVNIEKAENSRGILSVGLKGEGFFDQVSLSKQPIDFKAGKLVFTTAGEYTLSQITDVVVKMTRANTINLGPVEINKVRVHIPGKPWVGREFATKTVTVYPNDLWTTVF